MSKLIDKVVLVVGGSAGIGEGCVRLFHEEGAKVIFCSYNKSEGETLEKELNSNKEKCETKFIYCDVRNDKEIENVVKIIETEYSGQLDVLLNIVGCAPIVKHATEFSADEVREVLNINVVSHFQFAKLCIPMLRKTKGSIVNMSSMTGHFGMRHSIAYVTSKSAILGLTMGLALDESKYGVRVNSISPGTVKTDLNVQHINNIIQSNIEKEITKPGEETMETVLASLLNKVPLGRQGTPLEIARACLFLVTDASYATGADFKIDGGVQLWND